MTQVTLHVYDVTNTPYAQANAIIMRANNMTRDIYAGGVFHGAVEVNRKEWSFGYCDEGTGVYACHPKLNPMYTYRESIDLGETSLTSREISGVLSRMREEWPGNGYDLIARNCCHFCEAFCKELGTKPVPGWLNRFAYGVEGAVTAVQTTYNSIMWLGSNIQGAWTSAVSSLSNNPDEGIPDDSKETEDIPQPAGSSSKGQLASEVSAT
mmetsp:Transcript_36887/g.104104  ORF Transcript_36887/g.104104 Transcript_36887/m.104104 type:complete len:210 (-) Transcript_36887:252-881(-)